MAPETPDLTNQAITSRINVTPDDILSLVSKTFGRSDYPQSFPTVFAHGHPDRWVPYRVEGELRAFAATHSVFWDLSHLQLGLVQGVCIGSVCTHPDFQRTGLGRAVMEAAVSQAEGIHADFVFLFSDLDTFYRKCGFSPAGKERLVPMRLSARPGTPERENAEELLRRRAKHSRSLRAARFRRRTLKALLADEPEARKLWSYLQLMSSLKESLLSHLEFRALMTIPESEVIQLEDGNNTCGVAFFGKGADFQNVVHGFAPGSAEVVVEIASRMLQADRRASLTLLLPPENSEPDAFAALAFNESHMWYWKSLSKNPGRARDLASAIQSGLLYPRTLQGI